jgi:hypothetical protein
MTEITDLISQAPGTATAILRRFRQDAEKAIEGLEAIGADPKLIEATKAAYQNSIVELEKLIIDVCEDSARKQ